MQRIEIARLFENTEEYKNESLAVCGWVRTIRDSKTIAFMELSDGSCFKNLQVVIEDGKVENFAQAAKLGLGCAVAVTGDLIMTPNARQPFELHASQVSVEGLCSPEYPLQKKKQSLEYLRTLAHLRPRTNTFASVFRVRSCAAFAVHKFFNERGFVYVHTPIITGSDCEGAGEMFHVTTFEISDPPRTDEGKVDFSRDFFGKSVNLTVSGQLEGECMAMAMGRIYTFGPTFRAENSNTPRHAAEFWMIEPEMAFSDLEDDMRLARDLIRYVLKYILEKCPDEMSFFNQFYDTELITRITSLLKADFAHVTYTDAVRLLEEHKESFEYPVFWGCDLQTEHERFLTEKIFNSPVFVTDYPKEIKAFYMRMNDDGRTVAAMDLLVPGVGEIIGGSAREERLPVLQKRMEELGLREENYRWYMDLRRYGGTKHCGFGLGFERLIMYMTGISNIRDVIPFPRTTGNAEY